MSTPEVVKCPDGHFRRAIYGLGPYIADYPEQVWLAAIVQGWCPKYVMILFRFGTDIDKCTGVMRRLIILIAKGLTGGARKNRNSL
jgi:hypothetical protein